MDEVGDGLAVRGKFIEAESRAVGLHGHGVFPLVIVRRMPDLELRSSVTEHAAKIHME